VPGALELIDTLAHWLKTLTGMPAIALSPAAGAHGELCGIMSIRAALEARGDRRSGSGPGIRARHEPGDGAACGYTVDPIPPMRQGGSTAPHSKLSSAFDVAALMLTNPNTCGCLSARSSRSPKLCIGQGRSSTATARTSTRSSGESGGRSRHRLHHLNLHKTFSTPHGGGGPGSGPVCAERSLAPFAPLPWIVHGPDGLELSSTRGAGRELARAAEGFHGQMGMFVRALAYMMSHGSDGLRQVAEDAVLNANYLRARLADDLSLSFPGPCMHEVLFDDRFLKDTGVTTLDFAKALIDEGYHPMTMYSR